MKKDTWTKAGDGTVDVYRTTENYGNRNSLVGRVVSYRTRHTVRGVNGFADRAAAHAHLIANGYTKAAK